MTFLSWPVRKITRTGRSPTARSPLEDGSLARQRLLLPNALRERGGALRSDSATRIPPPQLTTTDMTAFQYDTLVDGQLEALPFGPHVWGDLFLPGSQTSSFVQSALAQITPADLAPPGFVGFVLLFPVKNLFPNAVAFRLPNEASVFLFDVLTAGDPTVPNYAATQIPTARARFEAARAIGGTPYPIGSTPMSKADWAQQYGVLYPVPQVAKQTFDPANILTPGPGIF